MNLRITTKLEIPSKEIHWRFSRSSGAGGQNVNKTDSRVEIVFNVSESKALSPYQKHLIMLQKDFKLTNGCISVVAQDNRSQYQNRKLALSRLVSILNELIKPPPKKRRETIPSQSSQRRRVELKRKRGELKRNRQLKIDS
tara:strand:- start:1668 stop:2090 length:423 start_codon:yes stop_codon:yes gene_type:complete